MVPLTFHEYQQLDGVSVYSDDKVAYNDMYFINFGEVGNAGENDKMLVCWFNVTTASHVLIGVGFNEQVTVHRIGVAYHCIPIVLLNDTANPTESVVYQLDITTAGLYSCSVFFSSANNSLVGVRVIYL